MRASGEDIIEDKKQRWAELADEFGFDAFEVGADFRIFCGLEDLSFPMMAVGACGLMNAVGNLMPKKLARMCELVWEGRMKDAQKIHYELFEINQAVFYDTNPIPIKAAMAAMGSGSGSDSSPGSGSGSASISSFAASMSAESLEIGRHPAPHIVVCCTTWSRVVVAVVLVMRLEKREEKKIGIVRGAAM